MSSSQSSTGVTDSDPLPVGRVAIIGLFITALVTAQLTASKVLAFSLPVSLPVTGSTLVMPGAALAYALTFFASDCYAELYGKRAAQLLVNVGFGLNFVLLALLWTTIAAPAYQFSPVSAEAFATALGPATNVVIASLLAYVVSQNWDVVVFHELRERTDGTKLWLRNLGSTASSQAIDTVIFVTVGFFLIPTVFGIGSPLELSGVLSLIVGQYLLKLLIAVIDTPLVYGVVGYVTRTEQSADSTSIAD